MIDQRPQPPKLFTVEEANTTLPLVRAIVSDLVRLAREVVERRQRLSLLSTGRDAQIRDFYSEELEQIEEELDKDSRRLQGYVEELRELGVEPKSATDGLVDFPTIIEGRMAYLCWKFGEPEIRFWHDVESGYRGRRPLPTHLMAGSCHQQGGESE